MRASDIATVFATIACHGCERDQPAVPAPEPRRPRFEAKALICPRDASRLNTAPTWPSPTSATRTGWRRLSETWNEAFEPIVSRDDWTEATWNPVRGCTKVSPGCKHCYAETFAERFRGVVGHPFEQGFDLRLVPEALDLPRRWRRGRLLFVNSMSDLFHEEVPATFIRQVFAVMSETPQHRFQVLTKRPERVVELASTLPFAPNIWMGVSVENVDYTWRIDQLQEIPAHIRFLSVEPLLGPLNALPLHGIDWVIVGGESGAGARSMRPEWARSIRDQCIAARVPFFFKQWGGLQKSKHGRILDGRTWNELPQVASIRRSREE